jgi:hypothetical protein
VAERVGMQVWKSVDRKGMLHFVYRVGREEFSFREQLPPR